MCVSYAAQAGNFIQVRFSFLLFARCGVFLPSVVTGARAPGLGHGAELSFFGGWANAADRLGPTSRGAPPPPQLLGSGVSGWCFPEFWSSGGYHFWRSGAGSGTTSVHLDAVRPVFFRFASMPFYTSRAEVATRQPPSKARRPCACLPRTMARGEAASQQRTIGRRPRCDASSEPEIRAQTIINAPTRGVGDGASDGGRSSPATGQWFAGPPSASHPGKEMGIL